jgi:hypothetical protein
MDVLRLAAIGYFYNCQWLVVSRWKKGLIPNLYWQDPIMQASKKPPVVPLVKGDGLGYVCGLAISGFV